MQNMDVSATSEDKLMYDELFQGTKITGNANSKTKKNKN